MAVSQDKIKLGVIGIGVGAAEILPAMERADFIDLYAGCDVNPSVRERFKSRYPEARIYESAEMLVQDPDVEAVWISTPNRFHAPMTILAAEHGKHVVVEKPMALNLEEASAMVEACEKNGVKLVAGHTQSFGPHIRLMRQIVRSGEIGALCAVNTFAYTDWVIRPRTSDELDPAQGGGLVFRQTPHQIDSIRSIGGGKLRSVRGTYGQWLKGRQIPGYYAAFMEFESNASAVAIHNGYGYFVASELVPWGDAMTRYTHTQREEIRRQIAAGTRDEEAEKLSLRIGGEDEKRIFRTDKAIRKKWKPNDLGIMIVSCEQGEMRQSPYGVYVYSDSGIRDFRLSTESLGRDQELRELYNAVRLGRPVFHSGAWGMATLEVTLAIIESAKTHRDIVLHHQVELPEDYDEIYRVVPESVESVIF